MKLAKDNSRQEAREAQGSSGNGSGEGSPQSAALTAEQRASLLETMQKHTLSLVWTLTKRDIEATVRAAVDSLHVQTPALAVPGIGPLRLLGARLADLPG